ncbi:hypothetical protein GNI_097810 [Gregarina niphandrodes]|uniref:Uncharacterized protein n=1 Tax=Gregarina niphandrodes TaxID=110365 RepID=A0A023B4T4_GRENI|nr:hypothetical protein GNI_097810 [Gregarina niphandrodes]EZG57374.1 hypothetical protein GNI_097810 [Gregarina niphandrodes]|eukprot:XP_011131052.1 hypothetical protein GNI_097810 [Gregarina niphandrodes]
MKHHNPITEATTNSYTPSLCDAQFSRLSDAERYKYAVSCDCKAQSESDLVVNCKPVATERKSGNITMSAHDLAWLRIPSDTCKGIYDNNKNASMVDATADGWKTLDWSSCMWGGKVVCVDDRGEDLSCHYFNHPFKHDFPRVWEAVIRHLKPARCLLADHGDIKPNYLYHLARGRAAAEWLGSDIYGIVQQRLYSALGLPFGWQLPVFPCSGVYNACQLPKDGCRCIEGRFSAEAVGPSEEDVIWGDVTDFFTTAAEMKRNYSLFQTPGYSPKSCTYVCRDYNIRSLDEYRSVLTSFHRRTTNKK